MNGTPETYPWWEKTVEYLFVKNASFLKLCPLDGDHEQAGDVILQNPNSKYYLIEFKKGASSQGDEYIKYLKNYDRKDLNQDLIERLRLCFLNKKHFDDDFEIFNELKNIAKENFHFVIFATRKNDTLFLKAQQYLDYLAYNTDKASIIEWHDFESKAEKAAVCQDKFLNYINKLIKLKKGKEMIVIDEEGRNSSSAFANILAINNEGETCTLLDIINSKTYQEKFPPLNLENIKSSLELILSEVQENTLELTRVSELIDIVNYFENYLYNIQRELTNKYDEINDIFNITEDLKKNLDKLKQELTPSNKLKL